MSRHYLSGWRSAARTCDMDAAEDRFLSRTGERSGSAAHDEFLRGYTDRAADNPYSPGGAA